jgi:diguanylate cyclase (GGDEF)-like protein
MFETTKLKEENEKFKEENEKIKVDNERLLDKSIKCDLTRLYNKNKFMEDEKTHCELYCSTIAFVDGDKFKNVNDTYGHEAGDKVLMKLGDTLFSNVRAANVKADVYRFGGEEIIIWFHDTDPLKVFTVLEDIRAEMEDFYFVFEPMEGKDGPSNFHVTVSIGVAFQLVNESLLDLRKRADAEVYNAKTLGRNRISISEINKAEKKVFSKFRDNFLISTFPA